eukprot:gene10730-63793_t
MCTPLRAATARTFRNDEPKDERHRKETIVPITVVGSVWGGLVFATWPVFDAYGVG